MDSWSILSATATLTNNISTIYAVGNSLMTTLWNTVGKVKLYNFRLVQLFQSLHSMRPSLWKSHGYVATPYFFTWYYQRLPAKPYRHLVTRMKTFCKRIEVAAMAVLSVSAGCRTNRNHMTSCRVQSFPWIRTARAGFRRPRP